MRSIARSLAFVAALAAASLLGCTSPPPVAVQYDQDEDLGRYRTWDWIEGRAVVVRAPSHDAQQVEARLTELLASALRRRGLERSPGNPEVRVAALLVARRSVTSIRRATAMQTLPSFHDQGNFEIQSDVADLHALDRVRLSVFVTGARQEKLLWQGELNQQFLDGFAPHLGDALETLLANFPAPETATD
jgi:hypothetical protein